MADLPSTPYGNETEFTLAAHVGVSLGLELIDTGTHPFIERTIAHIGTEEVCARFIANETTAESTVLATVKASLISRASILTRNELQDFTALLLGRPVDQARMLGRRWHESIRRASKLVSVVTDGMPLKDYLCALYLEEVRNSTVYKTDVANAEKIQEHAQHEAAERLGTLLLQLTIRRSDPDLIEAAKAWANSPDSQRYWGPDNQGFNAGLIHFFEYRSDKDKAKRFHNIAEPMTVDGFISFTQRLKAQLDAIWNPSYNQVAVLQDSEGNGRFFILQPNGDFIVAFQKYGQPNPRMTSMTTQVTQGYFDRVVDATLSGHDRGFLNRLGPQVARLL